MSNENENLLKYSELAKDHPVKDPFMERIYNLLSTCCGYDRGDPFTIQIQKIEDKGFTLFLNGPQAAATFSWIEK